MQESAPMYLNHKTKLTLLEINIRIYVAFGVTWSEIFSWYSQLIWNCHTLIKLSEYLKSMSKFVFWDGWSGATLVVDGTEVCSVADETQMRNYVVGDDLECNNFCWMLHEIHQCRNWKELELLLIRLIPITPRPFCWMCDMSKCVSYFKMPCILRFLISLTQLF